MLILVRQTNGSKQLRTPLFAPCARPRGLEAHGVNGYHRIPFVKNDSREPSARHVKPASRTERERDMNETQWHPGAILGLSGSYWSACTLHAGVKLDVFTTLGDDRLPGDEIARKIGADEDAARRLLDALTAMNLLEKENGCYGNRSATRTYLSKDSPQYLGHMIMHHQHLVESWSRLDEAVRSGRPVRSSMAESDEWRESFLMGMFDNAMFMAPRLVASLDLSGRRHLLDLGGGPGTYAIHFCLDNPALRATVFDLPTTRPFAEKTIERFELNERIDFVAGDYVNEEIEGGYDVVFMSHVLHGEDPDTCRDMIRKAVKVLDPGGMVAIHDFFLNDTMDGPPFPALFSLNMLLGTEGGRSYSAGEIRGMLSEAGVSDLRRTPFRGPTDSGIITGTVDGG